MPSDSQSSMNKRIAALCFALGISLIVAAYAYVTFQRPKVYGATATQVGALQFTQATGTHLSMSSALRVTGQNVCLQDGTNCQAAGASTETLASVTQRGSNLLSKH